MFGYEARKLYREHKKRMETGNSEYICEASIGWTGAHLGFCALCGIVGGTVGGLLGSGGGFVLGPLLLEIGVVPQVPYTTLYTTTFSISLQHFFAFLRCFVFLNKQVASATATFVMMFSSSLSVVEFYLLDRFPMPYGGSTFHSVILQY